MAEVTFDQVSKIYPDGTRAVNEMSLEIEDGEFMVLVGPSGCGKSTALRMVAGLEEISEGVLRIGDRVVNHVAAKDRDIAMVFQSYALYPHLSVYDNIAFGLRVQKVPKDEVDKRVQEAARILGLEEFLKRKPRALSGGQRQRVAMGRAIVRQPAAFLMDEPLSNLDAKLRVQMRAEINRLQSDLGTTTIYVTHDQVEAMTMGDRVAVMRKGELQQVASPQELYDHPVNLFVGGFIGSPAMNMLEAELERPERRRWSRRSGARRSTLGEHALGPPGAQELRRADGRPRHPAGGPERRRARARAARRHALQGEVSLDRGARLRDHGALHRRRDARPTPRTCASSRATSAHRTRTRRRRGDGGATLVGRFDPRSKVRVGETTTVAVDTRQLHFFDPETGAGIYDKTT